jgi:hypothetical protein
MPKVLGHDINHLALIGNFLPRKCGLATFTTDCFLALRQRFPEMTVDVYAMDDRPGRHVYPPEVTATIPDKDLSAYLPPARSRRAARRRSGSSTNTASMAARRAITCCRCSIARRCP